jgi:Trypsin/IPT/TIG domain
VAASAGRRGALDWNRVGTAARAAVRVLLAIATALLALTFAPVAARASEPTSNAGLVSPAIVGGGGISITLAPWQVEVEEVIPLAEGGPMVFICGGSILATTKVVTAAHCVFNGSKQVPAADIIVTAGTSELEEKPKPEREAEQVKVSGIRVHPGYAPNPGATEDVPDDVAVLNLEQALVEGPSIRTIALAPAGASLPEGTAVKVAGFGEENPPTEPDGTLNSIAMSLVFSNECGGKADAVFLCGRAASGSVCFGDSGSGLTIPGSPAMPGVLAKPVTLVGVTDTVEDKCAPDALSGFANVTAPEIRDFIDGDETPPPAPRADGAASTISGTAEVGHSLTCAPGGWSGSPSFTYTFSNSADDEALQKGSSSTYALSGADVGRTIFCQVAAANAGGTGAFRTAPTSPVASAPAIPQPRVASITPDNGPAGGGTAVQIKGTGFLAGATVAIGAAATEVKFVSSTELTVRTPAGSGSQEVIVSDRGVTSEGGPSFTYSAEVAVGIAPILVVGTPLAPVGGTPPPHTEAATAGAGNAALVGATIAVQSGSTASVKVACRGTATCRGQLTLTTKSTVEFKGKPTLRTVPIGSAGFSVLGGGSKTVKIKLGPVGRALLSSGHGRLSARLSIVKVEPAPRESQVKVVQLVAQRVHNSTK